MSTVRKLSCTILQTLFDCLCSSAGPATVTVRISYIVIIAESHVLLKKGVSHKCIMSLLNTISATVKTLTATNTKNSDLEPFEVSYTVCGTAVLRYFI